MNENPTESIPADIFGCSGNRTGAAVYRPGVIPTTATQASVEQMAISHLAAPSLNGPNDSRAGLDRKISGDMPPFGDVVTIFQISPDGQTAVYIADAQTDEAQELYRAPLDGSRAVYMAAQDTASVIELYCVPLSGGTTTKLNGPLVSGGSVAEFAISADGSRGVYTVDQQTDEVVELFAADKKRWYIYRPLVINSP